mmetsp:Transcript_5521/g.20865  ORF Transcript_5521/g.20865 Transcript_5521/m.20865 type:complete len:545 (+) Transcript_5521:626-2260(+)
MPLMPTCRRRISRACDSSPRFASDRSFLTNTACAFGSCRVTTCKRRFWNRSSDPSHTGEKFSSSTPAATKASRSVIVIAPTRIALSDTDSRTATGSSQESSADCLPTPRSPVSSSAVTFSPRARTLASQTASSDPSGGSAKRPTSVWNSLSAQIMACVSRLNTLLQSELVGFRVFGEWVTPGNSNPPPLSASASAFGPASAFVAVFAFDFFAFCRVAATFFATPAFVTSGSYPSNETPKFTNLPSAFSGNNPCLYFTRCRVTHAPSPASCLFVGMSHVPTACLYSTISSNQTSQVRLLSPFPASLTLASKPAMSSKYSCACVNRPHCRLSRTSSTHGFRGSLPGRTRREYGVLCVIKLWRCEPPPAGRHTAGRNTSQGNNSSVSSKSLSLWVASVSKHNSPLRIRSFFRSRFDSLKSARTRSAIASSAFSIDFSDGRRVLRFSGPNFPPPGTLVRTIYSSKFAFHSSFGTRARICGICVSKFGTSSFFAPKSSNASTALGALLWTARIILRSTSARPPLVTRHAAAALTKLAASSHESANTLCR